MVGAGTVRLDHPRLNVREPENWQNQPLRLVASNSMDKQELDSFFPDGNAEVVRVNTAEEWNTLLTKLGSQGIMALLIEGGGTLAASALQAKAVDYVEFHIAPRILGGAGSRPTVGGIDPENMSCALDLQNVKITRYGEDVAVSGYLKRSW